MFRERVIIDSGDTSAAPTSKSIPDTLTNVIVSTTPSDRRDDGPWWKSWFHVGRAALGRLFSEVKQDNLSLVAAGAAFFGFLSIFPALSALVALFGVMTDPAEVENQLQGVFQVMPTQGAKLVRAQLLRIASNESSSLGSGVIVGILVALWSANKGMKALVEALNIAFDRPEDRGFVRLSLATYGLTGGAVLFLTIAIALIAGIPAVLAFVELGGLADELIILLLRWPVLAIIVAGAIALLYRLGPARRPKNWRWITPGSVFATIGCLAGSAGFSLYVSWFGSFADTYGPTSAVAVLMLWLYVLALAVLVGAEIDAVRARNAHQDSLPRQAHLEK